MEKSNITEQIALRLKMGVPKSWFYKRLEMDRTTFNARLQKSNWKKSEELALKEMGVWYE